jgi:copper chaperone CopZ
MRKLVVMLSVLWLTPFPALGAEPGAVVEVEIKNMACPVCARAVGERISTLPGVQDVKISLKTDTARVVMAPGQKPNVEQIRKAVAEAGFEPGAVTIQPKDQK